MNIKLFKLSDNKLPVEVINADNAYINDLNDSLFDDDYFLDPHARNYLFPVIMVESDSFEASFKKIKDKLVNPVLILSGKGRKAFKGALELNARLTLEDYHPLVVKGNETDDGVLIKEVAKVILARNKISNSNFAIIGDLSTKQINQNTKTGNIIKKHNINVIKIGNSELEDVIDKVKPTSLPHKAIISKLFDHKDYLAFNKLYNALMYLVDKYNLSAVTFNVDYDYHFLYPLASLMNEKGVSFILENDLCGLLSLALLNALNDSIAIYSDIINVDLEKNELIIASSSVPFSFISKNGTIDNGDITLMKFAYDNKHFIAMNGKITSSRLVNGEMEMAIHLEEREMFDIFRESTGGTIAFTYGDSLANIFAYDNILFFENKRK